jgi:DNA polymerase-1
MNILPTPNIFTHLPPQMSKDDKCAIDVELFGLDPKRLHRPAGRFGSVACTTNGTDVYIIFSSTEIKEFMNRCSPAVWIFHNSSFDVSHLRRWTPIEPRKRLWDTMLIEKIMYSGYYNNNEFGLNDLVRRYCDIYLEKTQQKQFTEDTEWTPEKVEYAAKDVVATWMVYHEQKKIIDEQSLEVYKQIDLPAMWVTLGFKGVKVNTKKWIELASKNTGLAKEIGDELDFNPRSPKQTVEALNKEGMDVTSSGKRALERSDNETAKSVLEFRKYAKRSSTYGEKWVEQFVEADGRVYASWQVSEAITGRMSCRAPNLQNIPVRETPEYRECFIAGKDEISGDDNVFVIADWSAQEPRIAAYLSGDKKLIDIFNSDKDVYIEIAKEMFNETITKSDPRRAEIKEIVIGACNGLTEYGLARKFNIETEEAKEMFDRYFETFPELYNYRENVKNTRPHYVETLCGRKTWLNQYAWGWERTGMDSPIQGSASDAMKLAMIEFTEKWGGNVIVLAIHDELVVEVPKSMSQLAKQLLEETMVDVAQRLHPGIQAKVSISVGKSWAEKK